MQGLQAAYVVQRANPVIHLKGKKYILYTRGFEFVERSLTLHTRARGYSRGVHEPLGGPWKGSRESNVDRIRINIYTDVYIFLDCLP